MTSTPIWAVLPAAGVGQRMGVVDRPKQYLPLAGATVIEHSLRRLLDVDRIQGIVVAVNARDQYWQSLPVASDPRIRAVTGGGERHQSVLAALAALQDRAAPDDWVLVHDAVRPCVTSACIHRLITELEQDPVGGLLGFPLADTLKRVDDEQRIAATVDRQGIWAAATPQMFRHGLLREALQRAAESGLPTDEAMAVEQLGYKPRMVAGRRDNLKITVAGDLELAALILQSQASVSDDKDQH